MKIYLVFADMGYDGDAFVGAFVNKADAESAADEYNAKHADLFMPWWVDEVDLKGA